MKHTLGFDNPFIIRTATHEGMELANLNSNNSILVNCSLIEGCYEDGTHNLIFLFTLYVSPGYTLVEDVFVPVFLPKSKL